MEWEDDVDRLDVAVRADLFQEDVWILCTSCQLLMKVQTQYLDSSYLRRVRELECTKSLPSSQRSESSVVVATSSTRVALNLSVERRRHTEAGLVVVIEILELPGIGQAIAHA